MESLPVKHLLKKSHLPLFEAKTVKKRPASPPKEELDTNWRPDIVCGASFIVMSPVGNIRAQAPVLEKSRFAAPAGSAAPAGIPPRIRLAPRIRRKPLLPGVFQVGSALAFASLLTSCSRPVSHRIEGYIEGEFVYVASPIAGALEQLPVQRGAQVKAGDPLFVLESAAEKAGRDEAERRLLQARATLEDAKKGKRPSEIESIQAQFKQAQTSLELSEKELARAENLLRTAGAATEQDTDRARSTRDQDRQRVAGLMAELETARLGARPDQVTAAEANVRALEAALARAEWDLAQKRQSATQAGTVFDTLYREGEWVAAGRPIVALLPPANIKLRVYVPQGRLGALHVGDPVQVFVDGTNEGTAGKISFISPRAEYTPPVLYSRESRSKLVFLVEATFEPAAAARLHPGQPVDVQFNSPR